MFDFLNDTEGAFLYQKIGDSLNEDFLLQAKKEAETQSNQGFADTRNRKFPIFNEKVAAVSSLYLSLQEGIPEEIQERVKQALDLYNIEVEHPQDKTAAEEEEAPPEDYLFPQQRKILIQKAEDVKTAEEVLLERADSIPLSTRTYVFRRLQEKAAQFGVPLERKSILFRAESRCHVPTLCANLRKRRAHTLNDNIKEAYFHLESELYGTNQEYIDNPEEKDKLAQVLYDLDNDANITHRYNRPGELGFPDAIVSVFNTEKTAEDFVRMAGREIPLEQIAAADPQLIGDLVGDEFMEDIKGPNGEIDPQELSQTLSILPADMQQEIIKKLGF